jgi:hypothetical protein
MSAIGTYRLRGPVPSHFRYWRLTGGAAPVPCRSFSVWTRTRPRVHTGAEERRSKVDRRAAPRSANKDLARGERPKSAVRQEAVLQLGVRI